VVLNKLDDCRIVAMHEGWRIERQKRAGKTVILLSFLIPRAIFLSQFFFNSRTLFFFFISNCNYYIKSAKWRNPYTREVYKRTPKRDEQRINLKSLHNSRTLF
jgi:hypothetical protein